MARVVQSIDLDHACPTQDQAWLTGQEMSERIVKPKSQLIDRVLGGTGVNLLSADPKAGKSFLALAMCCSVTTGNPFLGHFPVRRGPVVYWQADDTNEERFISEYQSAIHITNGGKSLPDFEALIARQALGEGGMEMIEANIRRAQAVFAVVDCLQSVRDPRARDFVKQEFDEIRDISAMAARNNCTVLLLHHAASGKRTNTASPFSAIAGSYGVVAAQDNLAHLTPLGPMRTERMMDIQGRDLDSYRFIYARDRDGQLFLVADGPLAEVWKEAYDIYERIGDVPPTGALVGEAAGVTDRQGRSKLLRLRLGGAVQELAERRFAWDQEFRKKADRVIAANAVTRQLP